MKKHKHAEVIKAWADGAEIECAYKGSSWWPVIGEPRWSEEFDYRVKPAEPERTKILDRRCMSELSKIYDEMWRKYGSGDAPTYFASDVLFHAIDAGQVVTHEEFDKLHAEMEKAKAELAEGHGTRDARDMKVASAVAKKVCSLLGIPLFMDLESIIKRMDENMNQQGGK